MSLPKSKKSCDMEIGDIFFPYGSVKMPGSSVFIVVPYVDSDQTRTWTQDRSRRISALCLKKGRGGTWTVGTLYPLNDSHETRLYLLPENEVISLFLLD